MPELLTKYPDAALTVLKSAGAKCGVGAPQTILKQCPKERFCATPGGETCVYSLPEIGQMTQLSKHDLAEHACAKAEPKYELFGSPDFGGSGLAMLIGLTLGAVVTRRRR